MAHYNVIAFPISVLILSVFHQGIHCANSPSRTTASIYESTDKNGPSITYADDLQLWSDFSEMKDLSLVTKPTLICVNGM
jgi:hypothetical protein